MMGQDDFRDWDNGPLPSEDDEALERMTICIAATCRYEDKPCVLLCHDLMGFRGDTTSEDTDKLRWIGQAPILLAGQLSPARELCISVERAVSSYQAESDSLAFDVFLKALRKAVGERKREIIDGYLLREMGLSYEEFRKSDRQTAQDLRMWDSINGLGLNAELIISTFTDDEAAIVHIGQSGEVSWVDHYATAGHGARTAQAFLCQRDYDDYMEFDECLLRVLEAKVAAEKTPFVGQQTWVEALTAHKNLDIDAKDVEDLTRKIATRLQIVPLMGKKAKVTERADEDGKD